MSNTRTHAFLCVKWFCLFVLLLPAGCGQSGPRQGAFIPIDADKAIFWDRQTTETAELLKQMAAEFNASQAGPPIQIERSGNYGDIFRKVSASIQAGKLPAMAVSYESMTAEYIPSGAVVPLDDVVTAPETGFTADELDDFFPAVLETNRYPEHGNRLYSFPFAKSVLMLYYNKRVLEAAGIAAPPQTWDEFLAQCRRIRETTGKPAYAAAIDASTVSGMIYSRGGGIVAGRETLFDAEASIAVFQMFQTLAAEDLAYQVTPGTFDDQVALVSDEVAFTIRTSSGRENVRINFGGYEGWGMAMIPQLDPASPATVLFGPNINIFNTTQEQQQAAWAFTKYFTQPDANVRWALGTGYLPMRRSAAEHPLMQEFFASWDHARAPFDALSHARPEPNIAGWQEVRTLIERAQTAVLSRISGGKEAALRLKQEADAALARN